MRTFAEKPPNLSPTEIKTRPAFFRRGFSEEAISMKKRNWLVLLAIAACLALYVGYRAINALQADQTAPEITFSEGSPEVSVEDPKDALLRGVSATDNRDGDISASVVVERVQLTDPDGSILVRYAVADSAGNVSKAEQEARYTDYKSPRFSLTQPLLFPDKSAPDLMDVIKAADTLDGEITQRIRATSLDGTSASSRGSHEVEFRVTNSLGDTARLVLPVEVYAAGEYSLDVSLTSYLIYLDASSDFDAERYLNSVTRNRETESLKDRIPDDYAVKITGDVNTRVPGVYTVDYLVTHTIVNQYNPENNQISTGWSRLIVVVEG